MKKWIIVIISLLILLLLILPGAMGIVSEKRIKQLIANIPDSAPFKAQLVSYHRGWFSSTTVVNLTLPNLGHATELMPYLQVNESITHGPVIFNSHYPFIRFGQAAAEGEISLPEQGSAKIKPYIDQSQLFSNKLFLHYLGQISFEAVMPDLNINHPAPQVFHVVIEGLNIQGELSRHGSSINTHSAVQSMSWSDEHSTITLTGLKEQSDLTQKLGTLWLGDMGFAVDDFSLKNDNKPVFSFKTFAYKSTTKESKGLLTGNTTLNLNSIVLNGVTYGPAELQLNLTHVNAAPLAKLKALTQLMVQDNSPVAPQHIQRLILQTITRGLTLTVAPVTVTTPNGDINAALNVMMPNLIDGSTHMKHPKQISVLDVIQGLNASLSFSIPKVILENNLQDIVLRNMSMMGQILEADDKTTQALSDAARQKVNAQINAWVSNGFLVVKENAYQINASYDSGKVLLNGKPLFNPGLALPIGSSSAPSTMAASPQPDMTTSTAVSEPGTSQVQTTTATQPAVSSAPAPAAQSASVPASQSMPVSSEPVAVQPQSDNIVRGSTPVPASSSSDVSTASIPASTSVSETPTGQ